MPDAADVVVIGGGPAGSTLALRLAQLGRRVVLVEKALVEKATFPGRHACESLTGGVLPLLDAIGLRSRVVEPGLLSPLGATVSWAGQLTRPEAHGPGYLVDRAPFDSVLLDAARESGVRVLQPARMLDRTLDEAWSIRLDTGEVLRSKYLADAGGRSRALNGAKVQYGIRTLAMYACWSGVEQRDGDMLVEAGESEWYWGAPLPGGKFNAMVFVDAENAGPGLYRELLRKSRLLWPRLANAVCGPVRVCDATPFVDGTPVAPRSIKVGDAAVSLDPLSSQGVQAAMGTALHAAAVINTILDRPDDAQFAMNFYRKRLKESTDFHSRAASRFYREQLGVCGNDFWRKRAMVEDLPPATAGIPIDPHLRVRVSERAVFVTVGVLKGPYIEREQGVELGGKVSAYFGGAVVADLLRVLNGSPTAIEVVQYWSRKMPKAQALQTLHWAWAEGLIESVI